MKALTEALSLLVLLFFCLVLFVLAVKLNADQFVQLLLVLADLVKHGQAV